MFEIIDIATKNYKTIQCQLEIQSFQIKNDAHLDVKIECSN